MCIPRPNQLRTHIFTDLTPYLPQGLRSRRQARKLTQARLAKLIGSSQSRVAKMEAADSTVALDLLFRSLLATGATRRQIARIIQGSDRSSAA